VVCGQKSVPLLEVRRINRNEMRLSKKSKILFFKFYSIEIHFFRGYGGGDLQIALHE